MTTESTYARRERIAAARRKISNAERNALPAIDRMPPRKQPDLTAILVRRGLTERQARDASGKLRNVGDEVRIADLTITRTTFPGIGASTRRGPLADRAPESLGAFGRGRPTDTSHAVAPT